MKNLLHGEENDKNLMKEWLEEHDKAIRAEVIDEILQYCNQNNDEKEECWSCCLSLWEDGQFKGCFVEQLKEQNK